jgi:hypothetical protein
MAKTSTALNWIVTEAKSLKKKYPKRFSTWKEYVAQASAIYASKHKGKSPVGKKRKVGSTLYLEKNEKTTDPIKKAYRIERDAKGRITKYHKAHIEDTIVYKTRKAPKEKFFYKNIFKDETGKRTFEKFKVAEQFDVHGITLFRASGDKFFTEAKTGLSWPMDLYNLRDFKAEMLKGKNGAYGKRLEQTPDMIERSIKQYGLSPLYK